MSKSKTEIYENYWPNGWLVVGKRDGKWSMRNEPPQKERHIWYGMFITLIVVAVLKRSSSSSSYNSSLCSFDNNNGHWIRGIGYWSLGRLCCGSIVKCWYDSEWWHYVRPAVRKLYIPFRTQMFNSYLNRREMSWWKTHRNTFCDLWDDCMYSRCEMRDARHSSVEYNKWNIPL